MSKITTKFIKQGNNVSVIDIPDGMILESLPPKVYNVTYSNMAGYGLSIEREAFELPNKIYGTTISRTDKVETLYDSRDRSTGVLLTGLKGAGKSLMMKTLANRMLARGIPVLIVQEAYTDVGFMTLINKIGECVILFDEFGKTYKRYNEETGQNAQERLLTLFDGMYSAKRLILLAENNTYDIDQLYINRPSRVLFHWDYSRLEQEIVEGYCADTLNNKSYTKDVVAVYSKVKDFTFDSLMSLVAQCNTLDGTDFEDILDGLNIEVEKDEEYKLISVICNDNDVTSKSKIRGSILTISKKEPIVVRLTEGQIESIKNGVYTVNIRHSRDTILTVEYKVLAGDYNLAY